VQLQEALGRPPELKEFTRSKFSNSAALSADEDEAWRIYSDAVQSALTTAPASAVPSTVPGNAFMPPVAKPQPARAAGPPHPNAPLPEPASAPPADYASVRADASAAAPSQHEPEREPRSWAGRAIRRFRSKAY
jgi:hypothetical protein